MLNDSRSPILILNTEPKLSLDVWFVKAVIFALAAIWDFRFMVFLLEFLFYYIYSSKIFLKAVSPSWVGYELLKSFQ